MIGLAALLVLSHFQAQSVAMTQFSGADFPATGTDAPGAPNTWDIVKAGQVVASSSQPADWDASYDPTTKRLFLGVPLATIGEDYEVRVANGQSGVSINFTVSHFKDSPLGISNPFWMAEAEPRDGFDTHGAAGSVEVNTASGVMIHSPQNPDQSVNNPTGPDAIFERTYRTDLALRGIAQPGLPVGWTHNYAFTFTAQSGSWGPLVLHDPFGGVATWTPVLDNGNPTGEFKGPTGIPIILSGTPKEGAAGQWDNLQFNSDVGKWAFIPDSTDPDTYRLRQLTNQIGHFVRVHYDTDHGFRPTSVENDEGLELLRFNYSEDGLLTSTTSRFNQQVRYTYENSQLSAVSTLTETNDPSFQMRWSYTYTTLADQPFMETVNIPNPAGEGLATCKLTYDPGMARCVVIRDAEDHTRNDTYNGGWHH